MYYKRVFSRNKRQQIRNYKTVKSRPHNSSHKTTCRMMCC